MVNMRNLDSKESQRVKYKDNIWPNHLKLWFENDWYFCSSQGSFESDCPEPKFRAITLQNNFRNSRTQMFFKIYRCFPKFCNRKTPVLESLFKKLAELKVSNIRYSKTGVFL